MTVFNRGFLGMTNREGFVIFINKIMNVDEEESFGLNYGGYLITNSHEVANHGLRNLINSNSGMKASQKLQIKVSLMMKIIILPII